jgi:photosystem II stability/assembly factor-like uncharacterized protein
VEFEPYSSKIFILPSIKRKDSFMHSKRRSTIIWIFALTLIATATLKCGLIGPTEVETEKQNSWQVVNSGIENENIQALAVSPVSSDIVYAGSLTGIYKTTNGGRDWRPINTGLTSRDIKALVVHPEESQVVYCGTWGDGVFRSNDAGGSWTPLSSSNIDPRVHTLAVSNENSNYVWVATNEGLYKSEDGGKNWIHSYYSGSVLSVALQPGDIETVYIGIRYQGSLKSMDGGKTWSHINDGLFKSGSMYASPNSFAFDPQDINRMFASTGWIDIYVTQNGGMNWSHIGRELEEKKVQALAIDPEDSAKIYAATESEGVWRSVDEGESWSKFNKGLSSLKTRCIVVVGGGIVYVGTADEGIFKYVDAE